MVMISITQGDLMDSLREKVREREREREKKKKFRIT